jgi:hypothetical protein
MEGVVSSTCPSNNQTKIISFYWDDFVVIKAWSIWLGTWFWSMTFKSPSAGDVKAIRELLQEGIIS